MIEYLGYLAAILTTGAFIPQAIQTIKTKDTKGISLLMYLLFLSGIILWFIYGLLLGSNPLIAANIVTGILSAVILYYKLTEGKRAVNTSAK